MSEETCYDLQRFLKAMADETRQNILALLRDHEMSVSELCEHLTVLQPTVSHHLTILRQAGLVTARHDGLWTYYRANPACISECCGVIMAQFRGQQTRQYDESDRE